MQFGMLYSYWGNEWKCNYIATARKVKEAGFDILEVGAGHLLEMTDTQLLELQSTCADLGLKTTANIGPAKQYDVASANPATREAGIRFLSDIMAKMNRISCDRIVGVMYTYWPNDFTDLDKAAIWERGAQSVRTLGKVAEERGIEMCLEVVNRFETHILNTCGEGIQFCKDVGSPNVKLLLDTFHMNIEEDNIPDAIRQAGTYLGQLHVGEGNRRLPGKGSLPWSEIGRALRDIRFQASVVMEPFVLRGGQVGKDIKVWRDLSESADEAALTQAAAQSLQYLKAQFQI